MAGRDLTQHVSTQVVTLRRDPSQARMAGVCAGVTRQTGIDVRLVRLSVVVLALGGGLGLGLYTCGWLLLPTTADSTVPLARIVPAAQDWNARRRLQITLAVSLVIWLVCGSLLPLGPVPLILGLIVFLVHRQQSQSSRARDAVTAEPTRSQFDQAMIAWQSRVDELRVPELRVPRVQLTPAAPLATRTSGDPTPGILGPTATRGATALPRPSRLSGPARRSLLAGAAATVLALGFGQMVFSAAGHLAPERRLELALAAALAVVGASMIALGMARVRPRLLGVVGVLLCVWIGGLQLDLVDAHGTWSRQHHGVGTASDPVTMVGVGGTLTIPASSAGSTVHIRTRAARVTVLVPDGLDAQVGYRLRTADVVVGRNHAAGSRQGSLTLPADATVAGGRAPASHTVGIQLDAVASRVEVRHG